MTQFYIKDLSKLTGVSPQTLHHYDRIDLLKPSVRMANDYRLYGEKDLLKLKKIVSLKFFGFELSQIRILLESNADIADHFLVQARFLYHFHKILINVILFHKVSINPLRKDESHNIKNRYTSNNTKGNCQNRTERRSLSSFIGLSPFARGRASC